MKTQNDVKISKIHLESFIDTLVYVFEGGAEYIDLILTPNCTQDNIGIVIRQEYCSPLQEEEFNGPLTEDDINQLITT